tara:strand:- start:85 stop:780 length:696 start_codon:yes stop_codon:yes gene_type:complete
MLSALIDPASVRVHITAKSQNKKVGKGIPVTTSEKKSCPKTCPFLDSCYASTGPLALHWAKTSEGLRGGNWNDLCNFVESLPKDQFFRHNQAGDLFATDGLLDTGLLDSLVKANKNKKGYTYTHHVLNAHNVAQLKKANSAGFTVNASCQSLTECDAAISKGLPTVCVVDSEKPTPKTTPAGHKVLVCPAQTSETSCDKCRLCQKSERNNLVIAFKAHGTRKKLVNEIINS